MSTESTNEKDPLRPGCMSSDLIQALIDNYRRGHARAIKNALGIEDANSIWFDLPKLKKFISIIEDEAAKINPDMREEDLGIRFYYAAYPKAENWDIMRSHPVEKEYAERHTLVMIPTTQKSDENGNRLHYDFNPLQSDDFSLAMTSKSRTGLGEAIAENHGALSPPMDSRAENY